MRFVIGIDPGSNGGIAWSDKEGVNHCQNLPDTKGELLDLLRGLIEKNGNTTQGMVCYLENVIGNAGGCKTAQQGVGFGRGYGQLEMALLALGISRMDVTPQTWQKKFSLGAKGKQTSTQWKNVLKQKAQNLFPAGLKVTNATADALLIMAYGVAAEREASTR